MTTPDSFKEFFQFNVRTTSVTLSDKVVVSDGVSVEGTGLVDLQVLKDLLAPDTSDFTLANLGGGAGPIGIGIDGTEIQLRTLKAGTGVQITVDGETVEIAAPAASGESNTASNQGAGDGIFIQKAGADLEFKSLIAGDGIDFNVEANQITLSTAGEANTVSNAGGGAEIANPKSGVDIPLKTLTAGANIQLNVGADEIEIEAISGVAGETNSGTNVGTGFGVYKDKSGAVLRFKSLKAGTGVSISDTADEITINASSAGGTLVTSSSAPITTQDVVIADANSAAVTITLPDPSSVSYRIDIKKIDSSANVVAVAPFSGERIEAVGANFELTAEGESITLVSDGTDWWAL